MRVCLRRRRNIIGKYVGYTLRLGRELVVGVGK